MLAPLIALLPFFPLSFRALPVNVVRPAPIWDEGADVWLTGEPGAEEMIDLVANAREEFCPMEEEFEEYAY